jgi:putative SOS response-associated peptidase YedK
MCGRARASLAPAVLHRNARALASEMAKHGGASKSVQTVAVIDLNLCTRRDNFSPGLFSPVLYNDAVTGLTLRAMKWGLVPSFIKASDETPDHFRMFNARSETINEKRSFSRLVGRQRCVILLNGFYE